MSTTQKIIVIAASVLLVCLIAAGIIIGANAGRYGSGPFGIFTAQAVQVDESAALDLSGVDTVNVECVSGRINITGGEPGAQLTGSVYTGAPKDHYLSVTRNGGTLTVKFDSDVIFPQTITANVVLSVALPDDAAVNLNVAGASADANISGLRTGSLKNMRVHSASGMAEITDCAGDSLNIDVTSGRINIGDLNFDSVGIGCVSGTISVQNVSGSATVTSTSGTVNVAGVLGEVSVTSTSGSVSITQPQQALHAVYANVTSGSVDVKLHESAAFDLNARSTSGGFSTDFDVTVSGSSGKSIVGSHVSGKVNGGGAAVSLNTISGGIRVSKISE